MVVNVNNQAIILSNYKTTNEVEEYIKCLSNYYKINSYTINKEDINISELDNDKIIHIIPNKKKTRFEKEEYTVLEVRA